tara:strand:+ start:250 stop:684 length:435 start_codon:yes stop_codon:yes gene_type:complete
MKKTILILFFVLGCINSSFAGSYSNKFTNCLVQNTTERDKVILVRWMFAAVAQHSALQTEFQISKKKINSYEIAVADYIQYVLGTICFKEAKNVLNYEGEEAFLKAFEFLGEVAMVSLIEDPNVTNALENYIKHVDPNFLKKFE